MTAKEKLVAINELAKSVNVGINFLGKIILSGNVNFLKGWVVSEHINYRLMISTSGIHVLSPIDLHHQRVRRHNHIGTLSEDLIKKIGVKSPLFNLETIRDNLKKQFLARAKEFEERADMMKKFGNLVKN